MNLIKPLINIKIIGAATSLPNVLPLTNLDILNLHPVTKELPDRVKDKLDKTIKKQYGHNSRFMIRRPGDIPENIDVELTGEDLALDCVKKIFRPSLGDIDFFIHGTTSTSRYSGSQAAAILGKIKQMSPAVEMKAGCSTSLASLHIGINSLMAGYSNVMINCVETLSKLVNVTNKETWFGLGDASAGIWMEKRKLKQDADFRVLGMIFGTNGEFVDMYTTRGKLPPNKKDLEANGYSLSGDGAKLKVLAKKYYNLMFNEFKKEFKEKIEKVNYIIPHQVNISLVNSVIKNDFKLEKANIIKDNYEVGNVGGSSVLYSLAKSINEDRFKKNDLILLMSVGGGLSYCMQLWEKL